MTESVMLVGHLRQVIKDLPDDAVVWLQTPEYGSFHPGFGIVLGEVARTARPDQTEFYTGKAPTQTA